MGFGICQCKEKYCFKSYFYKLFWVKIMSLYKKLLHIKSMYESILDITIKFANEFNVEISEDVFKNRASILSQIESEEKQLKQLYGDLFRSKHPDIVDEIVNRINSIISVDKKISERFKEKMVTVKLELSGLFKNSRAAAAYSVQRKC